MSIADDILQENENSRPGGLCWWQSVSEAHQTELVPLFANQRISNAAISRGLKKNGYQIGQYSVSRHRRGECACR